MDKFTVATVQMRLRLHSSLDEYKDDVRRFLRAAEVKRSRLVLFPEMAGLMLAPLLLRDMKSSLLRKAEQGRRRSAGAWEKIGGRAAGWLAGALKADLRTSTSALLDVQPQRLWELYAETYGALARAHGVTIVAPSAYVPAPEGGSLLNQSAVFGPDGSLLGRQSRVLSLAEEGDNVARGSTWEVIQTEVGRVGLMLGTDVLYPEVGRMLAYQNAELLLLQGAAASAASYNKLRAGILARMQENQLYAAASFAVGESPLRPGKEAYTGRSAIFAPQELTPKSNGLLVEMGSGQSEGVLTAEWDYVALRRLWEVSETPLRRPLEAELAAPLLAALYTQIQALPQAAAIELLPPPPESDATILPVDSEPEPEPDPAIDLDDLPLLGSVTSRWPLTAAENANGSDESGGESEVEWSETVLPASERRDYASAATSAVIRRDDETDEMDAIDKAPAEDAVPASTPTPEDSDGPEAETPADASAEEDAPRE